MEISALNNLYKQLPRLMMDFLGVVDSGLLLGSMKGTVLQGSKKPVFPLGRAPFHKPGTGGLAGLRRERNKIVDKTTWHFNY